jgi:hypothetical protein
MTYKTYDGGDKPMRVILLAAGVVVAGLSGAVAEEAGGDRAERLIARLGSGAYRDREAASRELDALGSAALGPLRRAAVSADPETRRRAGELVRRIDERLTSAQILAATLVEFDYRDRPLDDAVRDLARRAGPADPMQQAQAISLHVGPPNVFHNRRVTAATPGRIPFWEAVDLFCRKAGLHEWDGFSRLDTQPTATQSAQWNGQGFQGGIVISGRVRQSTRQSGIVLLDGAGPSLPTFRTGAFRVRVPSAAAAPIAGLAALGADEVVVPLQMSAEPRLRWQGAVDVRIDSAVDDRGQQLAAVAAVPVTPAENGEMMFINGVIVPVQTQRGGPVGVRIRRGEKPATRLTALAGTIAGQVRITEKVVSLDEPLKPGQSGHGIGGVTLKVTTVSRSANGDVMIGVEATLPPDVLLTTQAGMPNVAMGQFAGGGGVVFRGGVGPSGQLPALPSGTTENIGLSLEDAKGRRFTVVRGNALESQRFGVDGGSYQFTTVFKPAEKDQEPVRLAFAASRPATIEIPFALKDVPLP